MYVSRATSTVQVRGQGAEPAPVGEQGAKPPPQNVKHTQTHVRVVEHSGTLKWKTSPVGGGSLHRLLDHIRLLETHCSSFDVQVPHQGVEEEVVVVQEELVLRGEGYA